MPAPDDVASVRLHNAAVAAMGRYDYAAAFEQLHTITQSNPMWMDGLVDLSIAQLLPSAGLGLRYKSPIGAIRLDGAYRFNLEPMFDQEPAFQFHFGLSEAF